MSKKKRGRETGGLVTALGLIRFYEETESKIKISPNAVVALALGITLIAIILRFIV